MKIKQMVLNSRSILVLTLTVTSISLTACAPQGSVDPAAAASAASCRSLDFQPDEFELASTQFNISIRFSNQTVTATEGASGCSRSLTSAEQSDILAKVRSISTCSLGNGVSANSLSARSTTGYFGIDNPSAANVTMTGGYNTFHSQLVNLKNDVLNGCAF